MLTVRLSVTVLMWRAGLVCVYTWSVEPALRHTLTLVGICVRRWARAAYAADWRSDHVHGHLPRLYRLDTWYMTGSAFARFELQLVATNVRPLANANSQQHVYIYASPLTSAHA